MNLSRSVLYAIAALSPVVPTAPAQHANPADPLQAVWAWAIDPTADAPSNQPFADALQELDPRRPEPLLRPGLALRLVAQLDQVPAETRERLAPFLAEHEDLAAEVATLLEPADNIAAAYAVLADLVDAHGQRVAELAPLAAAICAVHDDPRDRRVNENTVPLIDPVALFAYYADNERAMHADLREGPATLFIHLADAAGSLEQYDWARKRYGRDRNVGNRYQEITYDTRAFTQDDVKKRVTEAGGYSLQTIRQYGGVCADQAYFALSVGKASGIPSCYVVGKGGEVSHAWLGFVENPGRDSMRWNFEEGRYEDYEDVRGSVLDPQSWERVPDAYLSVEAYSGSVDPQDRRLSVALLDAAGFVGFNNWRGSAQDADQDSRSKQLELLEAALRTNPGNLQAWLYARNILAAPTTTLEQKEHWTRAVDQLAGQLYPDFAFEFLKPVFDAEPDLNTRFNLWDWAAKRFSRRQDLAAQARLAQARIMIDQGRKDDAVTAARATFDQYPESGPYAVQAIALAADLLQELGRGDEIPRMYEQAFRKINQPRRVRASALRQTTWFQVGKRYADALDAAGDTRQAATIKRRLGLDTP